MKERIPAGMPGVALSAPIHTPCRVADLVCKGFFVFGDAGEFLHYSAPARETFVDLRVALPRLCISLGIVDRELQSERVVILELPSSWEIRLQLLPCSTGFCISHVLKCGPRSWRTKTQLPADEKNEK